MKKLVETIFRRYGTSVSVYTPESTRSTYAFIQHSPSVAEKYILPEYTALGEVSHSYARMLFPLHEVRQGYLVLCSGQWYTIHRVEQVCLQNQPIYDWCLCVEREEGPEWLP